MTCWLYPESNSLRNSALLKKYSITPALPGYVISYGSLTTYTYSLYYRTETAFLLIHCSSTPRDWHNLHIKRATWTSPGEDASTSSAGGETSNRNLDIFPSRSSDILICNGIMMVLVEREDNTRWTKVRCRLQDTSYLVLHVRFLELLKHVQSYCCFRLIWRSWNVTSVSLMQ